MNNGNLAELHEDTLRLFEKELRRLKFPLSKVFMQDPDEESFSYITHGPNHFDTNYKVAIDWKPEKRYSYAFDFQFAFSVDNIWSRVPVVRVRITVAGYLLVGTEIFDFIELMKTKGVTVHAIEEYLGALTHA